MAKVLSFNPGGQNIGSRASPTVRKSVLISAVPTHSTPFSLIFFERVKGKRVMNSKSYFHLSELVNFLLPKQDCGWVGGKYQAASPNLTPPQPPHPHPDYHSDNDSYTTCCRHPNSCRWVDWHHSGSSSLASGASLLLSPSWLASERRTRPGNAHLACQPVDRELRRKETPGERKKVTCKQIIDNSCSELSRAEAKQ